MEKHSWNGHASMLGANTMWGLMSPISKLVMASSVVTPFVVTELRVGGAMLLFWLASLFQKPERVAPRDLLSLLGASLIAIVLNQGCFIFGVSLSTPGDASIITTSMPLWALVLAALILKEKITGKKLLGIAAGAGGALLLILCSSNGSAPAGSTSVPATAPSTALWGDLLVLLAQLCYALYIVLYKNFVTRYSLITLMKWMFTFSFLCTLPFTAGDLLAVPWASLPLPDIWGLLFIVICGTFLSYMLIVIGQKNLRPTVAGMYNYIQPLVACLVAISLGLDTFSPAKGLAVALIFGGVYLVTRSSAEPHSEPDAIA